MTQNVYQKIREWKYTNQTSKDNIEKSSDTRFPSSNQSQAATHDSLS